MYLLLFLCVVVVLYGYIQPYRAHAVNIVEVIVEVNFFFLLLLVSSQLLEQFLAIPFPSEGSRSSSYCVGSDVGVATVTWILTPLYYLPLLVLAGLVTAYIILLIRFVRTAN